MAKNLLVICNSFPDKGNTYAGGIFIKDQIKYLERDFDNIYVVAPVAYGVERLRGTNHLDYEFDNVKVYFPKYINSPIFWYRGRSAWLNLESRVILSLIKREGLNFDLMHAHFTWPSGAVAARLKETYPVPLVITEHTSSTFHNAISSRDRVFEDAWCMADRIIRVNPCDAHLFDLANVPRDKVAPIANGFDRKMFYPMESRSCKDVLSLEQDKKVLLSVGNLYSKVKGHRFLIEAVSRLAEARKDILCVIIGEGKLRGALERQIHDLGLSRLVVLPGGRPHDEIPLWINASDIFVLPSLEEGNPTVMFEALGCGKPFVGTRVGGVPGVIVSEDHGLLVNPADSVDLAEKISIALDREWDQEAIARYSERYTWENIAEEILGVYRQVVTEH